jgi:hypothetical protein
MDEAAGPEFVNRKSTEESVELVVLIVTVS